MELGAVNNKLAWALPAVAFPMVGAPGALLAACARWGATLAAVKNAKIARAWLKRVSRIVRMFDPSGVKGPSQASPWPDKTLATGHKKMDFFAIADLNIYWSVTR